MQIVCKLRFLNWVPDEVKCVLLLISIRIRVVRPTPAVHLCNAQVPKQIILANVMQTFTSCQFRPEHGWVMFPRINCNSQQSLSMIFTTVLRNLWTVGLTNVGERQKELTHEPVIFAHGNYVMNEQMFVLWWMFPSTSGPPSEAVNSFAICSEPRSPNKPSRKRGNPFYDGCRNGDV